MNALVVAKYHHLAIKTMHGLADCLYYWIFPAHWHSDIRLLHLI